MNKKLILTTILLLLLFLSMSAVNAFLFFGDGTYMIECEQSSIEVPDNYTKSPEWTDNQFDNYIYIWGNDSGIGRDLMMWEVSSFESVNHSDTEQIIDTYDGDLKVFACYDPEESSIVDGKSIYGCNYTYVEFDKDGHHYVIKNEFKGDMADLDINKDVKLFKNIQKTVKSK